jgi:hypothetical protein
VRLPSRAIDAEVELLVQSFEIAAYEVAHLDILEVVPAAFVPRVQIGGVGRQPFPPDPTARVGDELLARPG